MEVLNYVQEINSDFIDETKTWISKPEKIWDSNMNRVLSKEAMSLDEEYVIF